MISDLLPEHMKHLHLPGGFQLPPFGLHQWLALIIVGVGLWLVGSVWLGLQAGQQWVNSWQDDVVVHVYFPHDQELALIRAQERFEKWPSVASVQLRPVEEGVAWLQEWLGDTGLDAEEIAKRLPLVLVLRLGNHDESSEFIFADIRDEAVRQGGFINEDELLLARMHGYVASVKYIVLFVTILLALAMALIISNTLRMMQLSHQEEMALMRLMGAKEWFVRMPFMLEGALIGAGAGFLGGMLLWPISWMVSTISDHFHLSGDVGWISFSLMLLGLVSGCVGAWISTLRGVDDRADEDLDS
ncbi:MAG: cell division protein [Zetaproteobacteria bacterium]|nr:cell division protein [Zetaproteobacteria bacterium]